MKLTSKKYGTGNLISELSGMATIQFESGVKSLLIKFAGLTKEDGSIFEASVFEEIKEKKSYQKSTRTIAEKYITKSHLVEFKGLIIWLLNNKVNYNGLVDIKSVMTELLKKSENNEISYKTKRGIKGAITRATISIGLNNVEANLRAVNGISELENTNGNAILESFQQHRLNVLS